MVPSVAEYIGVRVGASTEKRVTGAICLSTTNCRPGTPFSMKSLCRISVFVRFNDTSEAAGLELVAVSSALTITFSYSCNCSSISMTEGMPSSSFLSMCLRITGPCILVSCTVHDSSILSKKSLTIGFTRNRLSSLLVSWVGMGISLLLSTS